MKKKNRSKNIVFALIISAVLIGIFYLGFNFIEQPTVQRICQVFGGNLPAGVIQFLSFVIFFWGLLEINSRSSKVKYEKQAFTLGLLPEKEHWVLSPQDVADLKIKMIDYEKENRFLMTDIIRKASTKFRSNNSISDVLEVVSTQIKINNNKSEGRQSIIRYLAWALPSVGFIGTILGIAQALGLADRASDPAVLGQITKNMYVAFDTTLVALILSIILMWFFHGYQEEEEELHTDMEEYVIENFVNRIHIE